MSSIQHIVFFDGHCNLCNSTVDFIVRNDRDQKIYFASLQSEFARLMLPDHYVQEENMGTLVFYSQGKLFLRSTAVLKILRLLTSWRWRMLYALIIFPPFLRDFFYRVIARNRLRWFGRKETCRIPTPEELARFLDGRSPEAVGLKAMKDWK